MGTMVSVTPGANASQGLTVDGAALPFTQPGTVLSVSDAAARILTSNGWIQVPDWAVQDKPAPLIIAASNSPNPTRASVICTGVNDDIAIQAAINSLNAGEVWLLEGDYYTTSMIVPKAGVRIRGSGYTVSTGIVLTGGTIIHSSAAAVATFGANTTDLGSPLGGQVAFDALFLPSISIRDLAIDTATYGLKFGALYNPGLFFSELHNLFIACHVTATGWGVWLENYGNIDVRNLNVVPSGAGTFVGQMFLGASGTSNYNCGNASFRRIFSSSGLGSRGIVFQARGTNTQLNDVNCFDIQSNVAGTKITQAATMTNASANIGVTDSTKFPVDMPVTFATTANGFTAYQTYYVVSSAANVIQIANKMRGAALNANNNTAVNIVTYGPHAIEAMALDSGVGGYTGCFIQSIRFDGIDAEGISTAPIALQNGNFVADINTIFSGQGTVNASGLVARSAVGAWRTGAALCVDLDSNSLQFQCAGASILTDTAPAAFVQRAPYGVYYDRAVSTPKLNLSQSSFFNASLQSQNESSGAAFLYPLEAMGQRVSRQSSTSLALWAGIAATVVYTGSTAATWTLPTIQTGDGAAATGNTAGLPFEIVNGASAAVAITLNTGGTNKFGYGTSAKTSYSIPQGGSITVRAVWDGTNGFWAVLSINGAT